MSFENDFSLATDTAREKVQQALSAARERTGDALARGGDVVRERPATALLAAFGIGLVVGMVLAAATRPEPRRHTFADTLGESHERLADLFGTVASNLRDPLKKTYASVSDRASSLGDSMSGALEKVCAAKKLRWW